MTKAALVFLGTALVLFAGNAFAQDNAAINAADNEAVIRQANVILLRQKLADAKAASLHGDRISAAKLYTESCTLAETIGSGAPEETVQSVAGLTAVRLDLARDAQGHGDLHEANIQVTQILNAENKLKVNPNGEVVLAFKKHNDELQGADAGYRNPGQGSAIGQPKGGRQHVDSRCESLLRGGRI